MQLSPAVKFHAQLPGFLLVLPQLLREASVLVLLANTALCEAWLP